MAWSDGAAAAVQALPPSSATATAGADAAPDGRTDAGWHARLELGFDRRDDGSTVLTHRSHVGPLRVQKALYPEGRQICHAVIVHPPGGIATGDRLDIEVRVGDTAHAVLTTPGATKWYKTPDGAAAQAVRLVAGAGSVLEWLPQETIVFNQARAHAHLDVRLGDAALFVGWDILCFGRTAMGETFDQGSYRQRWQIRQGGTLLWNESGELQGGSPLLASAIGLDGQPVCATLVAAGRPVDSALLEAVRAAIAVSPAAARMAATRLPQALAVRYLGPSGEEARAALAAVWGILRPHLTGIEAQAPRIWRT